MEKNKNISIRLNGKEQTYQQKNQETDRPKSYTNHEEVAAAKESDHKEWISYHEREDVEENSSKVVDLGKIREEKTERSMPYWDDGNRDHGPRLPPFGRKKRRPMKFSLGVFFNSVFLSIIAAIIVGSAFGLMLLNIFTDNETPALINGNENGGVTTDPEAIIVGENQELGFKIPSTELFVVQGGAFSTMEKGNEIATSFHTKGLPAVLTENTDPHFLFVGIGHSRDDADKIAVIYEDLQQDTYIKTYGIATEAGEVTENWSYFMELGTIWMEMAASLSAKELAGDAIGETEIATMLEAGQIWKNSFADVEASGEQDPIYEQGEKWLQTAEPAFQVFASGLISSEIAWDTQKKVLESLLTYEKLVETIVNSQR